MAEESLNDKSVLAYLRAKRAALDKAIAALEGKSGDGGLGTFAVGGSEPNEVQGDTFVGMNIATGSVKYLGMIGRPARTTEDIYTALTKGGLSHVSRGSVATILQRVHNRLHRLR